MKHLNLKRILEQVGETKEEFAKEIDISVQELEAYENGSMSPSLELLDVIAEHTDLKHKDIMVDDSVAKKPAETININDAWKPSQIAKNSMIDYIEEGLAEIDEPVVREEIGKIKSYVDSLRKPKISFAGQSDTGKSTMINAILQSDRMPAKWTPTTSIIG